MSKVFFKAIWYVEEYDEHKSMVLDGDGVHMLSDKDAANILCSSISEGTEFTLTRCDEKPTRWQVNEICEAFRI